MSAINLDEMTQAYLETQLWAQWDRDRDEDSMLDEHYGISDIAPEYVQSVRDELASVIESFADLAQAYHDTTDTRMQWSRSELFGHDFYLTRESHGTGFWDRGLGELGDRLTDVAESYGEANPLFDSGDGILRGEFLSQQA